MLRARKRTHPLRRTLLRSSSFLFFVPSTVSTTGVYGSLDSVNWVRHFRWRDPSKILIVSSSPRERTSEGLPTDTITTTITTITITMEGLLYTGSTRVAFVFTPQRVRHFEFMIPSHSGLGHRKTSVVSES